MAKKASITQHIGNGLSAVFSNPVISIGAIGLLGVVDTALYLLSMNILGLDTPKVSTSMQINMAQEDLIKLSLTYTGFMILSKLLIGPLIAALAVVISRAKALKKKVKAGTAINFALNRYTKIFFPYLIAQLSIQIGMIIIIPGIMFLMQYAFVDSVAALEDQKHVLTRSKKLTRPRRKSLLLLIIPYVLLGQAVQFIELFSAHDPMRLFLINFGFEAALFCMLCSFYMIYHERTTLIAKRRAEKKAKKLAEQDSQDGQEAQSQDSVAESNAEEGS